MAKVSINRAGIAQMMREIQREFDKHPVKVPVESDRLSTGTTTIFNGPVLHGDANGAQLAWGNETVTQHREEQVAPGYEILAQALVHPRVSYTDVVGWGHAATSLKLRDGDVEVAGWRPGRCSSRGCGRGRLRRGWRNGLGSCCWRLRGCQPRHRCRGRSALQPGRHVEGPLRRVRPRRAG